MLRRFFPKRSTALVLVALLFATQTHAFHGDCGQPSSTGPDPSASDALHVLRAAVGLVYCVPSCICDVDASMKTTAGDALQVLRVAVGISVPLDCGDGCGVTTTTSFLSTTTTMGPTAIERGRDLYDLDCASCHKAGSHDTRGFAGDLAGRGEKMRNDLGPIDESMEGLVYTNDEVADFVAFLESL
jgi:hypothetical protein